MTAGAAATVRSSAQLGGHETISRCGCLAKPDRRTGLRARRSGNRPRGQAQVWRSGGPRRRPDHGRAILPPDGFGVYVTAGNAAERSETAGMTIIAMRRKSLHPGPRATAGCVCFAAAASRVPRPPFSRLSASATICYYASGFRVVREMYPRSFRARNESSTDSIRSSSGHIRASGPGVFGGWPTVLAARAGPVSHVGVATVTAPGRR